MIRLCATCDGHGDVVAEVQPVDGSAVVLEPCPDCDGDGVKL